MTGKLIQRLQDPSRSGVYRVSRADEVVDAVKGSSLSPVRVKFADKVQLLKNHRGRRSASRTGSATTGTRWRIASPTFPGAKRQRTCC